MSILDHQATPKSALIALGVAILVAWLATPPSPARAVEKYCWAMNDGSLRTAQALLSMKAKRRFWQGAPTQLADVAAKFSRGQTLKRVFIERGTLRRSRGVVYAYLLFEDGGVRFQTFDFVPEPWGWGLAHAKAMRGPPPTSLGKSPLDEVLGVPVNRKIWETLLADKDPDARYHALSQLTRPDYQRARDALYPEMIALLTHPDERTRRSIDRALLMNRDAARPHVGKLLAAVQHDQSEILRHLAHFQPPLTEEEVSPDLVRLLKQPATRRGALSALERLPTLWPSLTEGIVACLDARQENRRRQALNLLLKIDPLPKTAVGAISDLLPTMKEHDRYTVLQGLAALGPGAKEALPILRSALRWRSHLQGGALRAIQKLGVEGRPAIPDLIGLATGDRSVNSSARGSALSALSTFAPLKRRTLEPIVAALTKLQRHDQVRLLEPLLELGTNKDKQWILEAFVASDDTWVSARALEMLRRSGGDAELSLELAEAMVRKAREPHRALDRLADMGKRAKAAFPLFERACFSKDRRLADGAVQGLVKIGDAEKVAVVYLRLLREGSPQRPTLLRCLGFLGEHAKTLAPEIAKILTGDELSLATVAANVLPTILPPEELLPIFERAYDEAQHSAVRRSILNAIASYKHKGAAGVPLLRRACRESQLVSSQAVDAIAIVLPPAKAVTELLEVVGDPEVNAFGRKRALWAIPRQGNAARAALPRLRELTKHKHRGTRDAVKQVIKAIERKKRRRAKRRRR